MPLFDAAVVMKSLELTVTLFLTAPVGKSFHEVDRRAGARPRIDLRLERGPRRLAGHELGGAARLRERAPIPGDVRRIALEVVA